jgi:hypothetical protein
VSKHQTKTQTPQKMTLEATLDHISARVTLSGVIGAILGTLHGMHRGHHILYRTAGLTGLSWAMVATACCGTERLAHAALPRLDDRRIDLLLSHAVAGITGGSLLGYLYLRKPLRGVVFFVPAMMGIALIEDEFIKLRERKQNEVDSM